MERDEQKVIRIDKHLMKAAGHNDRNDLITTKTMEIIVSHKLETQILDVQVSVQSIASLKSRNNTIAVLLSKRKKDQVYIKLFFFVISHQKFARRSNIRK